MQSVILMGRLSSGNSSILTYNLYNRQLHTVHVYTSSNHFLIKHVIKCVKQQDIFRISSNKCYLFNEFCLKYLQI